MATPAPASTAEAMDMVLTGLSYLAATDPTALAAQAQAECLQTLERADAISTSARARILAAFTAGQGYSEDADYSPTSWLIHRTRITKGAARGHVPRREARKPEVPVGRLIPIDCGFLREMLDEPRRGGHLLDRSSDAALH